MDWLRRLLMPDECYVALVGGVPISVHTTAEGASEALAGQDEVAMQPGVRLVID